ncbi:hypothetical protein [Thiobacillus sp.]
MKTIHIPILLAVLVGSISNASHAEFSLDKLKALADRAKAYQEKMKQGSQQPAASDNPAGQPATNSSPNLGLNGTPIALFNDEAQKLAAKYDVAGIKTGMSIAEARAAIKKKTHLKEFREYGATLVFDTVDGQKPFAKYTRGLAAQNYFRGRTGDRTGDRENISITFSPEPGQEKVVAVARSLNFAKENRPRPEMYKNALIEKYGQPVTYDFATNRLIWFYDHRGASVPLTDQKNMFQGPGRRCHMPSSAFGGAVNILQPGNDSPFKSSLDSTPRTKLREDDGALYRCGSLMITVSFIESYPRGLLEGVTTTMANFSLDAESSLTAGKKLEEAERAYTGSRIQNATKLKPDL